MVKRSAISLGIPMRLADETSSLREVVEERSITAVIDTMNLKNIMTPKSVPSRVATSPKGKVKSTVNSEMNVCLKNG